MIRKISSKEELEKKRVRNNKILVIVMGLILLLSSAGYFVSDFSTSRPNTLEYNGIEFKQTDYGTWKFTAYDKEFETIFNPLQTENISISIQKGLQDYNSKVLYYSGQPIEDLSQIATTEIVKNLANFITRVNPACLNENCSLTYPIKTCSDNILVFTRAANNRSTITSRDNCIFINYTQGQEEIVADAFLFKVLGI